MFTKNSIAVKFKAMTVDESNFKKTKPKAANVCDV